MMSGRESILRSFLKKEIVTIAFADEKRFDDSVITGEKVANVPRRSEALAFITTKAAENMH